MDWLRKLLENVEINEGVLDVEGLMQSINTEFPKNAVPKSKFNDISGQLKTANETIENLKNKNSDNAELQKTIKEHEETIKKLEAEAANTAKTYALKEQLTNAGVIDPDYIIYKQGGIDKFTFDKQGKPIGVEDVLKPLRNAESTAHLFKQAGNSGVYSPAGGGNMSSQNPFSKENWNLTKQGEMLRSNPEQARSLAAEAGVKL